MKWWMILGLALVACNGGDDADATETDTDTDADTDTDTDTDGDTDMDFAAVSGTITDSSGQGVATDIRMCRGELCLNGESDSTGSYSFPEVIPAANSFEILPENSALATAFAPIQLAEGEVRTIDIRIPALDTAHTLTSTPTEFELGTGLMVTVGSNDLEPPLFAPDATEVAGVLVPEADWPPLDWGGEAVAIWYTSPFDYHAPNGLPFRIVGGGDVSLETDATYEVWVGSYEDSEWKVAGTLTESAGVLTDSSVTLPLISTVALIKK